MISRADMIAKLRHTALPLETDRRCEMNLRVLAQAFRELGVGSERGDTHDYTIRVPGHDYTFDPIDGGMKGHMMGWGYGLRRGHYLILPHSHGGTTRYRIESVEYFRDPDDMWSADVVFAPREAKP